MTEQRQALPTGEHFALRLDGPLGEVRAVVTELAASLRASRVGGVALVHGWRSRWSR